MLPSADRFQEKNEDNYLERGMQPSLWISRGSHHRQSLAVRGSTFAVIIMERREVGVVLSVSVLVVDRDLNPLPSEMRRLMSKEKIVLFQ